MASVPIQNYPSDLTMLGFRAIGDMFGSLVKSNRFIARIRPQGQYLLPHLNIIRDLTYLCEVGELPGRGIATADDGIDIEKLPFYDIDYLFIALRAKCVLDSLKYMLMNGIKS